ncbi:MAG TPA: cytochrome c oxidase assembly protein [Candidatus Dormibacteraeota bacterium]|jgi:cytochrome c oxidase assembly factor CtaG|nr:cytochrome c oxidase assembly protein [Candidatus Dormibacteraeota bacterium]
MLQPLPLRWTTEPSILLPMLVAAGLYVWHRRADRPADSRPVCFWLGLLAFFVALVTPLDSASDRYLLSAHMAQHILITMVGPPLLLAGLPSLESTRLGALPRFILNPWVAVTLFNVDLLVWHWPALYQATLENEGLHIIEHVTFVATAFVFWWPITGPATRGGARLSRLMKVGYLAFAGVPPTVIGVILAFVPRVLYPFYMVAPRLVPALSPLVDQQLAGILMFGIGNLIYFVPLSYNFIRLLEEEGGAGPGAETDGAVSL